MLPEGEALNKFWIWIGVLLALYFIFKEDKPKQPSAYAPTYPTYTYTPQPIRSFHGYICTTDCSGHEAGYDWAMMNDIDDEGDCVGSSQSFIEGCRAYVEENN